MLRKHHAFLRQQPLNRSPRDGQTPAETVATHRRSQGSPSFLAALSPPRVKRHLEPSSGVGVLRVVDHLQQEVVRIRDGDVVEGKSVASCTVGRLPTRTVTPVGRSRGSSACWQEVPSTRYTIKHTLVRVVYYVEPGERESLEKGTGCYFQFVHQEPGLAARRVTRRPMTGTSSFSGLTREFGRRDHPPWWTACCSVL